MNNKYKALGCLIHLLVAGNVFGNQLQIPSSSSSSSEQAHTYSIIDEFCKLTEEKQQKILRNLKGRYVSDKRTHGVLVKVNKHSYKKINKEMLIGLLRNVVFVI